MSSTDLPLVWIAAVGGFIAGITTTLAGVGGGIALIALLSMALPPQHVIALTAPVLLVGNITRVFLYRARIDRPVLAQFVLGAVPATIGGAFLLPALPERLVRIALGGLVLLFVLYETAGGVQLVELNRFLPARAFTLIGAANGFISATAGGGGVVSAPFLYAHGLVKESFIGTSSAGALSVNSLKSLIYFATGLLTLGNLPASLAAATTIVVGNTVGRHLLNRVSEKAFRRFLLVALTLLALRLLF